jgi:hypothetical protein
MERKDQNNGLSTFHQRNLYCQRASPTSSALYYPQSKPPFAPPVCYELGAYLLIESFPCADELGQNFANKNKNPPTSGFFVFSAKYAKLYLTNYKTNLTPLFSFPCLARDNNAFTYQKITYFGYWRKCFNVFLYSYILVFLF